LEDKIQLFWLVFSGAFGAIVGSFLNVVIYRLPRGESLVTPRSHCPSCNTMISWYDNIPLLSYLFLRGKCRKCKAAISLRYPFVEFLGVVCFVFLCAADILGRFGNPAGIGVFAVHCVLFSVLIAITFIDFDLRIIPNSMTISGTIAALLLSTAFPELMHPIPDWLAGINSNLAGLIYSLIGAGVGAGITLATAYFGKLAFRKDAMGMGDVKLMAMFGALLGWPAAIIIFFTAPFLGIIVGVPRKLLTGDSYMAYGPFLAAACAAYIFLEPFYKRVFPLLA
jgi:leader peptidase (prepilin peptidase) / N-methyltransferase